ncbi:hypothetical protein KJI95_00405 [Shewanella sp. JM162201]|uniref:Translation initiation factor eIF2B subunit gamma n=1 Tax=Shewanella jiangmenensis TaxID=2837387 RepID=A0ABS5UY22_9GAMM|nr:sugar phosphate nucleotidyltransferase [Shewanella jiangmenensis]MBT1442989.1 hypothetical protein [Shewanella jiangmenensis]
MEAIVFANRHGNELIPLQHHYCPALLPIANRALIEYTLDDLKDAGVQRVRMVIGPMADAIEALIGDGRRWDLKVTYCLSHPQEQPQKLLARLGLNEDCDYLFVRGDILRSPCIKAFMTFATRLGGDRLVPRLDRLSPGLYCGKASSRMLAQALAWPLKTPRPSSDSVLEVLHGQCAHLDSFGSLMEANRLVAMGRFIGLKPRGARRPSGDPASPFYVGAHCSLPALQYQQGFGVIGEDCTLAANVSLKGVNVLGQGCVIGAQTELHSSLVLPGTAIGKGLYIKNKIVSGNLLIDPASGGALEVNDAALFCAASQKPQAQAFSLSQVSGRLTALSMLLALPLWPLASLGLKVLGMRLPIEFARSLKQVLFGRKALFSSNALFASNSHLGSEAKESTGKRALSAAQLLGSPASSNQAVFGPRQLGLLDTAPDEEIMLVEHEFNRLPLLGQLMLLRTLARARRKALADAGRAALVLDKISSDTLVHQPTSSSH